MFVRGPCKRKQVAYPCILLIGLQGHGHDALGSGLGTPVTYMSLQVKEREIEKRVLGQGSQWEIASPALVKRGAHA
jgi:hypothetical protein